jgi:hypothetical protein
MRPSALRQHAVVTYRTAAEADAVDMARLLDGCAPAQPRSAWLVARAVERPEAHAAAGTGQVRVSIAAGLSAWADLAARLGDTAAANGTMTASRSARGR